MYNFRYYQKSKFLNLEHYGVCASISAGVANSCAIKLVGGVVDRLILVNRADWLAATITYNGSDAQVIENVVMAGVTVGYSYEGKQQSIEPVQTLVKKRYDNSYDHEIRFKIFNVNPTIKAQIELMEKSNLVAIVENNFQGTAGNAAFEVYGTDAGLYMEELRRAPGDTELNGAYDILLKSDETAKEGHLPKTLFITSYALSKAVVDSIL